ncbi:glycosyltransferase family 2 protein [Natrialbaceae archaeon A-CW1-1]
MGYYTPINGGDLCTNEAPYCDMVSPITILRGIFFSSIFIVIYTHLLYPLGIGVLGSIRNEKPGQRETLPPVSLIIAAYNEEEIIAKKIKNSLELGYPAEKLEIIVFSDGSTDDTDKIVRSFADEGVRLVRIEGRVGKTECQNRVVQKANGDIIIFSDANSMYESDAIRALVSRFDEEVGCVIGGLYYEQAGEDRSGVLLYRRYERLIQRLESEFGSVVKGNGAIYAVRAEDYFPLPLDVASDFAEPLAIRTNGKKIKFASRAIAKEQTRGDLDSELTAKNRITTRSWNTLSKYTELLNPLKYGAYAVQLWSRTVLLWFTPLFLGIASAAICLLVWLKRTPFHVALFGGLVTAVASVSVTAILQRRGRDLPFPFQALYFFALSNYSLLVGLVNFLRGNNTVIWDTDNRPATNEMGSQ